LPNRDGRYDNNGSDQLALEGPREVALVFQSIQERSLVAYPRGRAELGPVPARVAGDEVVNFQVAEGRERRGGARNGQEGSKYALREARALVEDKDRVGVVRSDVNCVYDDNETWRVRRLIKEYFGKQVLVPAFGSVTSRIYFADALLSAIEDDPGYCW
jgi:hypothetical protein